MARDRGGMRLFAGYAVASLLAVGALGAAVYNGIHEETNESAFDSARQQASVVAASAIQPALDGAPVDDELTPAQAAALARATTPLLADHTVLSLRVRNPAGRVVFDAADPSQPAFGGHDEEVAEVAARGVPLAEITNVGKDAVDGARTDGTRAIEVYQPVRQGGRTLTVVEVYLPYAPIAGAIDKHSTHLVTRLVGGLVLLWAVLAAITWSVTRRLRRSAKANERLALYDVLTDLPNRTLFMDRAEHALSASRRTGRDVGIAILDLDRFKEVNDTLGHANGDLLLLYVAAQITGVLRPGDTVARLGGDEFGVVLPSTSAAAAIDVLQRVRAAISMEVDVGRVPVVSDASAGLVCAEAPEDDVQELLRKADLAMYAAKETHVGVVVYHPELEHYDPARLALVGELRAAIERDELVLHFQPKLDLTTGAVPSLEALVRWNHPTRGLLPPSEFLPIAESTGLIIDLTDWVLDRAARHAASWRAAGRPLRVAVNVSARSLRDDAFPEHVSSLLARHDVPPELLEIEITETAVISDPQRAAAILQRLHERGIGVALDDFGQGFTSLAHLVRLPIDELKIDREFVIDLTTSSDAVTVVRSVIELGHQLGLSVIAEGAETEATVNTLRDLGCDLVQGYVIARPMPAGAVEDWLHVRAPTRVAR